MTKDKSILIKNIYWMLAYAFDVLKQGEYENVKIEKFDHIHNLFAAILAKGIGRLLKQGLYREYVSCKEDMTVIRGKIDMQGTMRNQIARKKLILCNFDELSENNILNQIIKTTVTILIRNGEVNDKYKDELKKEMLFFSNVDTVEPSLIRWTNLRYQRNSQTYQMLISICQLTLEGMLQTTEDGKYKLASFVDLPHLSRLYERFILEYYVKEHPDIKTSASQIPWKLDDDERTLLPRMKSDTMLLLDNCVLIIDAKYYAHITQVNFDALTIRSNNLYQIFTYVKNKDASFGNVPHKVSGILLYARTDEDIQPDITYQMSGNQISVKTLDLNREFPEIAKQLDQIVEDHFGNIPF